MRKFQINSVSVSVPLTYDFDCIFTVNKDPRLHNPTYHWLLHTNNHHFPNKCPQPRTIKALFTAFCSATASINICRNERRLRPPPSPTHSSSLQYDCHSTLEFHSNVNEHWDVAVAPTTISVSPSRLHLDVSWPETLMLRWPLVFFISFWSKYDIKLQMSPQWH